MPKLNFYTHNRSLYLRCKTRERHDRRLTSRASNGLRMDIKLKILSYRKSPGRQKTAKRSPASSDRHPWRYCLVFRRRRLSHVSPSQAGDTCRGVSEQVPLQTSITELCWGVQALQAFILFSSCSIRPLLYYKYIFIDGYSVNLYFLRADSVAWAFVIVQTWLPPWLFIVYHRHFSAFFS